MLSEAEVRASLGAARERAFARLPDLLPATRGLPIVDGFRAAVAGLRAENGLESRSDDRRRVSGDRRRAGAASEGPRSDRARSERQPRRRYACRCCSTAGPSAREVAALDAYFVTVCDHGMNASTFTTRVVASTQADLFAP